MQQNLEQIRAANALEAAAGVDRKAVTKLPAMIVNNGLLAAAAFARDKSKELQEAMNAVAMHLADRRIGRLPEHCGTTDALLRHLVGPTAGSDCLRLAIQNLLEAREAKEPADKLAHLLVDIARLFGWGEQDWQTEKDGNLKSDFVYAISEGQWPGIFVAAGKHLLGKEPETAKDFGHFSGPVSFLPAYPYQLPVNDLELDVVTGHHGGYYSQPDRNSKPNEWGEWNRKWGAAPDTEEPIPVFFPAVSPGHGTEEDRCRLWVV